MSSPAASDIPPERREKIFPTLTPAQIERIAALGRRRSVQAGETLVEPGDADLPFMVVVKGALDVLSVSSRGEELLVTHGAGNFFGDVTMLSSRRSLARARMREAGEIVELDRKSVQSLVQSDSELSDILMQAFILRRLELMAHGWGDTVVVGSNHSSGTLRIREFLLRNGHPATYLDLEVETGTQELLDQFDVHPRDIPVVICQGRIVLRNPSNQEVAECLGLNAGIDAAILRDVVIVGAGPAGLAAAVYAASEGLKALVLETTAPGGQAGSSSKIENYLGFPLGISGQELAGRACTQALKFGAELMIARQAVGLRCGERPYSVETASSRFPARAIIVATGVQYRKPPLQDLGRFEGLGVYYWATPMEAQLCDGEEVVVIGGANSAGQAAVFLSGRAKHVHLIVRGASLSATMSRYLIRRIEESRSITLHTHTEITALRGGDHLGGVTWQHKESGDLEERDIRHVFVMTGADPNTAWLEGCLVQDKGGFVKTGTSLTREELEGARWPLSRAPHPYETSRPGVFAVGDVRSGNIKRVASAVGEGSIAVSYVHQVLQE